MSYDQRITVPDSGMVFGNSVEQLIHEATERLPLSMRDMYEPAVVLATAVGTKRSLPVVWKVGDKKYTFASRCYGKVVFTLKGSVKKPVAVREAEQMALFDLEA